MCCHSCALLGLKDSRLNADLVAIKHKLQMHEKIGVRSPQRVLGYECLGLTKYTDWSRNKNYADRKACSAFTKSPVENQAVLCGTLQTALGAQV